MPDLHSLVRTPLRIPSPLQRYRSAPSRHRVHGDVILAASGDPGPDGNVAFVIGPVAPEQVFAQADAFFDASGYAVCVELEAARPMDDALRAAGWHMDEEEPALALFPIPAIPSSSPGLTIRTVTTDAAFADFMALTRTGHRWIPSLDAAMDPAVALLVGYDGETPVAAARVARYGDVGDINGVVTTPDYRRHGIGTAMTWAAVAAGAQRGCTAMILSATEMGYPVYVRMGFVPVCIYRTYLPPGRVGSGQ